MRLLLQKLVKQLNMNFDKPVILYYEIFEDKYGTLGLETSPNIIPGTKNIGINIIYLEITLVLRQ